MNETNLLLNISPFGQLGLKGRLTLLLYMLTFFSVGVIGYYGYSSAADAYRVGAENAVNASIMKISSRINEFNSLVKSDLFFFSNNASLIRQLYWLDMKDTVKHQQWKGITINTWLDSVQNYDYLYKVRFIDINGYERIVLRRDPRTRQVTSLPEEQLQDRREEDYFKDSIHLDKNTTLISSMDLNREHGRIEKPLVPIVRLMRPVFGENNVRYGVVVINLFADTFFKYIRETEENFQDGSFYLIDKGGEFFYHADSSKAFAHLLGHGENLDTLFPGILEKLQEKDADALFYQGYVIGFKYIFPDLRDKKDYWIIISTVGEERALSGLTNFKIIFFSLVVLMVVLIFVTSYFYVSGLIKPLLFITQQLQRLGKGQVQSETLVYHRQDEIRQMLCSTERLITNMEALANQADTIAQGDLSSDVQLLSEQDRLGIAINNMTAMLRKSRAETNRQNWLKDGIGSLSKKLTSDSSPQDLAEQALSFIGQYLGVGRGGLYVYDPGKEILELLGSYMFTQRDHLGNSFRLGEGAVGQVAKERKPIFLTIKGVNETPAIVTGTTNTQPFYTHTWPLLREGELIGIMELGGFDPMTELQKEFLESSASVVTSFMFMALQRERIVKLLQQSEENAKQAEEQSRQLQETNLRMEEQQQQLQQQTEELQQTNAQMEEQRQQVEQQSNELRLNNEALRRTQEEVNARAHQLEEANRYKSDFLANMSHELRTPLNAIIVISKMMAKNEEGNLDKETVKRAQVVHSSGNDLLRLINDILDLSKIEAGRIEFHLESFSTHDLAEEMRLLFEESSREKKISYVVEDHFRGILNSDRHKIVQVLRNLLANAFKFTQEGEVALHFEPNREAALPLKIRVSDTGIGIPESEQEHIFEEFRQVDGSISRKFGGTGLGLSITKKFVELLRGSIAMHSVEGRGSEFILLLPDTLHPLHTDTHPVKPTQGERGLNRGQEQGNTILVIDDDPHFLENIVLINRKKNRHTLLAKTGEEGLALAKSYHPKGIILDLKLSDMRGEEVLENLKIDPELREIPVYIISAKEKSQVLLERGAVGFLQKPVTDDQIEWVETTLLGGLQSDHKRVLVIEGPTLRKDLIKEKIEDIKGYLTSSNSAIEGLECLSRERFDLVLVDHDMRDMDCVEFCEKLHQGQPNIPIIIFVREELDEERLSELRLYTDSVIQQAPQAIKRVFRGIERFLHVTMDGKENNDGQKLILDTGHTLNGKSILVVDDDPRNIFVLTAALEQNGAKVIKALNGHKGLELLEQEKVDLVIMDIMMPEMDGYQAIEIIRANPTLQHLPIIALTAKALKKDRQKCLDAGADDYLSKPVDYDMLVNMAQAWAGKNS